MDALREAIERAAREAAAYDAKMAMMARAMRD